MMICKRNKRSKLAEVIRGRPELLECFMDMNLRDAAVITKMSYSTMKLLRTALCSGEWPFRMLKGGVHPRYSWASIQALRDRVLGETTCPLLLEALERARGLGWLQRRIYEQPAPAPETDPLVLFCLEDVDWDEALAGVVIGANGLPMWA